jgi:hypothetical protein
MSILCIRLIPNFDSGFFVQRRDVIIENTSSLFISLPALFVHEILLFFVLSKQDTKLSVTVAAKYVDAVGFKCKTKPIVNR